MGSGHGALVNLYELADKDPDALYAILSAPDVAAHDLRWGAEWLGAKWTPDRWWPVLLKMLRDKVHVTREIALNAIEGRIVHEGTPANFRQRDWPRDVVTMKDEILAELDRVAAEDPYPYFREDAAELAQELRSGRRWYEDEEDAT